MVIPNLYLSRRVSAFNLLPTSFFATSAADAGVIADAVILLMGGGVETGSVLHQASNVNKCLSSTGPKIQGNSARWRPRFSTSLSPA